MGMKHGRAGYSVYRSAQWQAVRMAAKRRDDFKCTDCDARGRLEVHHKIPVRQAPELSFDLGNVECLCPSCHHRKSMAERGQKPNAARDAWQSLINKGMTHVAVR